MPFSRVFCIVALALLLLSICVTGSFATVDVLDKDGNAVLGEPSIADIPALVEYVVEGGVEARYASVDLVEFGGEAVPDLIEALEAGKARDKILQVMIQIRDERMIGPVSSLIADHDEAVSGLARAILASYGDEAAPRLIELLDESEYRDAALGILKEIGPSEVNRASVRKLTDSGDEAVRGAAGYLLGVWRDADAEEVLVGLMADRDPSVRMIAAEGYGRLHENDPGGYNIDAVLKLLEDADPAIRAKGAELLLPVKDSRVVEPLLKMVRDEKDPEARYRAVMAFEEKDEPAAVLPMIEILTEKDAEHRLLVEAVNVLGAMKAEEALPYILDVSRSEAMSDLEVQVEVFKALARIGKPVDVTPMLVYLKPGGAETTSSFELLSLLYLVAEPGDSGTIAAVKRFREEEREESLKELADKVLDRLE